MLTAGITPSVVFVHDSGEMYKRDARGCLAPFDEVCSERQRTNQDRSFTGSQWRALSKSPFVNLSVNGQNSH
ncbi:hypothetical protein AMJ40_06690 [candidate division TA06 bacterium DG_26]|uniref:Uncharacterized protein n=1 Tax=candidate division TA06 bacterium DG_26 TaxID=1703771 RepID=A0A0S7WFF7_UNCT6|nr:MAG: hypothetical protein AMJ40_06690 [candidate division TA06 bacterium DG_26]